MMLIGATIIHITKTTAAPISTIFPFAALATLLIADPAALKIPFLAVVDAVLCAPFTSFCICLRFNFLTPAALARKRYSIFFSIPVLLRMGTDVTDAFCDTPAARSCIDARFIRMDAVRRPAPYRPLFIRVGLYKVFDRAVAVAERFAVLAARFRACICCLVRSCRPAATRYLWRFLICVLRIFAFCRVL